MGRLTVRQDSIAFPRADFLQSKAALDHALTTTPDERLNGSPAPTSRTPIAQVAYPAHSIGNISQMLQGSSFPVPTTAEADAGFLDLERRVSSGIKPARSSAGSIR